MARRRNAWRKWPKRAVVEVHNDRAHRKVTYVLECGHRIERGYWVMGWPSGITKLTPEMHPYPPRFACGHCHHGSPPGAVAPDTGRCEFFERLEARRQLTLPGVDEG